MPLTRRDLLRLGSLAAAALPVTARAAAPAPAKPLRILILGGTGFIGPHEVRYALARGHTITLFNRGESHKEWPGTVEALVGDRNTGDLSALKGREWDVCIDNPTTLPFWVRDAGRALHGRVGQYIFVSTVSVYADTSKPGANESAALAKYAGKDAMQETQETLKANMAELYGALKAASEREAEAQFPGIATIVRPGLIAGPGDETDRFTYWPVRLARGGDVLAPGDGSDPVQFIDARDLSEWIVRLAEQRAFGTYHAVGPAHELTMSRMLEGIGSAVHSDAKLTWVPPDFLEAHKVYAWSDMPVWLRGTGDTAGFARLDNRKAIDAGLTFRPLAATANDTLAWFRAQPAERQSKLRSGVSAEREAQLLSESRGRGAK
ncbi:MAG: NAD-dependent epimerase/dehydratase family protein [Rhodanobacteraceae bacterium]